MCSSFYNSSLTYTYMFCVAFLKVYSFCNMHLWKLIVIASSVAFVPIFCIQTLYRFVPEHCEIKNINSSLVHFEVNKCFKLSRNVLMLNMSFYLQVDILSDKMGQLKITGYQFRSNEYRKGPIEFMLGMCSGLSIDQFDIPNLLKYSNLRCPFKKNKNYYAYNMSPNATNMPPLLPSGRWMMEFKYVYMNKYEIFTIEWYTSIEYDVGFRF